MTALPEDGGGPDHDARSDAADQDWHEANEGWDDEWNRDDWYELGVADRDYRNEDSWTDWLIKLGIVAIALPLVLGVLAFVLILIF